MFGQMPKVQTFWKVYTVYHVYDATSMLVTDVGDELCWRQLLDVGEGFGRFCHQHPLSFNTSLVHHHPLVTHIYVARPRP